ncbi:hypothetical protein NMY22_g1481 [Coprinellus aureogranulatus]|nr:hypothetical protein NMY22_g1481 [Coprinellus aureogranulatus]
MPSALPSPVVQLPIRQPPHRVHYNASSHPGLIGSLPSQQSCISFMAVMVRVGVIALAAIAPGQKNLVVMCLREGCKSSIPPSISPPHCFLRKAIRTAEREHLLVKQRLHEPEHCAAFGYFIRSRGATAQRHFEYSFMFLRSSHFRLVTTIIRLVAFIRASETGVGIMQPQSRSLSLRGQSNMGIISLQKSDVWIIPSESRAKDSLEKLRQRPSLYSSSNLPIDMQLSALLGGGCGARGEAGNATEVLAPAYRQSKVLDLFYTLEH